MLVNRRTFIVKRGAYDALLALLQEAVRESGGNGRILVPEIAPFDQLVVEAEFESLAAYEQFWSNWGDQPTTPAFMERWFTLTESGGTNEIWRLVE
jgi:hypothetical protein